MLLFQEGKVEALEHYHFGGIDFLPVTFLSNCLDSNASIKKKKANPLWKHFTLIYFLGGG